jgi:hypothetical protein
MQKKIIDFKNIVTKDKKHFLQSERKYFIIMTDTEYKKHMAEDAKICKKCNVWYWKECLKRCKCD